MIHFIPHPVSDGLRAETEVHDRGVREEALEHLRAGSLETATLVSSFLATPEGLQYARALEKVPAGGRVLDIGVGGGQSSLYLAARGYRVTAVEPSRGLCRLVESLALAYRLPLEVVHCAAEYLDRLPACDFDACVFNASLHHCDDPAAALRNCYALLRPGGRIFLLNEPILRLHWSKARFARLLRERPQDLAHYGGNEHTYYYHEYVRMLRQAGFRRVRNRLSLRYEQPRTYLAFLRGNGLSGARILARRLYYHAVHGLSRTGPLGWPVLALMRRLSLLQSYFTARR